MIHILLCPHALDYGGSQLSLHHWARHLDPSRFKVTVLAWKKGGLSEKYEAHYPVHYDSEGYPGIQSFIKDLKPDIVHCAPPGGKDLGYITRAAELAPVTQTVMCPRQVGNYDDVRASVVLSNFVLNLQESPERVYQVDAPFDVSDYAPRYGRSHFGLPEDGLIVGSLGNSRKENAHFMKVARKYRDPGVHFVMKSSEKFRSLFGRGRVTLINRWLDEDEKLSLMKSMDVFFYPTSNESYGVVFLEAMSQKVPVITYDDSANREVVSEGGLFAPLNDMGGLARLLEGLIADRAERERLGRRGYEIFSSRNDPARIAREYEALFEKVLGEAPA